ncbi:TonB-dependent receptor [candidate division KSB1 bacterium]|nr:TonB-dependent receptor [candidate division KSB1 bacterium]
MKRIFVLMLIIFPLLLSWNGAFAQASKGKIAGRVLDAETSEPLPGANVMIEGTSLGTAADLDGYYYILNIPPGRYTVKASMMGFVTKAKTGVVVNIGRTTDLDFRLETTILEGEEVVVTASKEIIRKDVSSSVSTVASDVIEMVPAVNLEKLMTNIVGISQDMMGLVIRGGHENEIGVSVDGLTMQDDRNNRPYTQINMSMVSEIEVLTGGYNAEYGNARSGILNIVTKRPKDRYIGSANYKRSPAALKHFGPYAWSNADWWDWGRFQHFEVNRSEEKYTNFLDQEVYHWFDENGNDIDRNMDGAPDFWGWNTWAKSPQNSNKLSPEDAKKLWDYQHRPEVLHYGDEPDYIFEASFGGPILPSFISKDVPVLKDLSFFGGYREEFSAYPWQLCIPGVTEKVGQMNIRYDINTNMYLTVTGILSRTHAAGIGNNDEHTYVKSDDYILSHNVQYGEQANRMYAVDNNSNIVDWKRNSIGLKLDHTLSPSTYYEIQLQGQFNEYKANPTQEVERNPDGTPKDVFFLVNTRGDTIGYPSFPRGWYFPDNLERGQDQNGYLLYGLADGRTYDDSWMNSINMKAHITSQINKHNQIKAGIDFTYSDIHEHRWAMRLDSLGTGLRDDNMYDVSPMHGALYIQDKMEFEGFILNIGLRYDFYIPESPWYDIVNYPYYPDAANTWTTIDSVYVFRSKYPKSKVPVKSHLSPRIGVAHPISENSKLYFNYGHFTQIPNSHALYWNQFGTLEYLEGIGNAWLKLPLTVSYEVGFEQNLFDLFTLNISGFYKDIRNDPVRVGVDISPVYGYKGFTDSQYRDIRGYELRLDRRFGKFITGFASFEQLYETIGYTSGKTIAPLDPVRNQELIAEDAATRARLVWEPVTRFKSRVSFHTPEDWGPQYKFLGLLSRPLGGWVLDLSYLYKPGKRFHYDPEGEIESHVLNMQWKAFQNFDLKAEKRLTEIKGVRMSLYLDVYNLFNHKNFNLLDRGIGSFLGDNREWGEWKRIFAAQGRAVDSEFRIYMDKIIEENLEPGDEVEYAFMPKRNYITYVHPRDIWFGIKFEF